MFKNNLKVLFFYIIILGITYGILSAFDTLYTNSSTQFNSIVIKLFFLVFYSLLFVISGKIVGTKERYTTDFFNFLLTFIIGIGVYLIALLGGGMNFSENMNILMLPAQIYLSPFLLISSILGRNFDLLLYVLLSIPISIIIGLSTRRSRVKRKSKATKKFNRKQETQKFR